jgi:hypothetical protein
MVMKKKAVTKTSTKAALKVKKGVVSKKDTSSKKVRVGILVVKDFDPVKKNTQWPDFPKNYNLTTHDWGKYSVDFCTALRMQQLHPDLIELDIMWGKEVTQKRLQKNHVNMAFWYEAGVALMSGDKKHFDEVLECQKNPECRLDPSWDYYDWVLSKPRYMEQCKKAGIPIIPTVIYKDGFDPKQCMKDVQKMGWDKFFCKVGHFSFFGAGAINGKTEDFLGKRAKDLDKYAQDNKDSKTFLLQPYTLKPDGEVFDEVRNFFIDGQWRYSVFTHGTDGSDAGFYEEPEGPRKAACKELAERAYQEVLKSATWQGKRQTPLLNRIDIGVVPKKGSDSLHKTDNTYFLNEIELICTTWLDRYSPISVSDVMAHASVKHALELLVGLLKSKRKVPDEANVRKVCKILNNRIGPYKHISL